MDKIVIEDPRDAKVLRTLVVEEICRIAEHAIDEEDRDILVTYLRQTQRLEELKERL